MNTHRIKTCFISAPFDVDISSIRRALDERNVEVIGPSNLAFGHSWHDTIVSGVEQADLVIGVLTHEQNASTMFELGMAVASRKALLIFAPAKGHSVPSDLVGIQVVRANLKNQDAIDFALDQILSSPARTEKPKRLERTYSTTRKAIVTRSYKELLHRYIQEKNHKEIEVLVAELLKETGLEVVAESRMPQLGIDLVVWSDDLQPFVGNPFPIEIKTKLRSRADVKSAIARTSSSARKSGALWSILLYGDGPAANDKVWLSDPNVLTLSLPDLLRRLENESFPEIVVKLRNNRVHGSFS